MLSSIDHLVLAVADLAAATRAYAGLLGREPSWEGAHPGMGTRNTLFRLANTYLELLTADGEGALGGLVRDALRGRDERPFAIALGVAGIDGAVTALRGAGFPLNDPMAGSGRDARNGTLRTWRSAFIDTQATRGLRLFVIEHTSPADLLPPAPATAEPKTTATGVDHVVLFTQDLDASLALWQRFGLRQAWRQEFPERGTHNLGLKLGGITIELIMRMDRPTRDKPDTFWGVAYRVGDCALAAQRVRVAGVEVDEPRPGSRPGHGWPRSAGREVRPCCSSAGPERSGRHEHVERAAPRRTAVRSTAPARLRLAMPRGARRSSRRAERRTASRSRAHRKRCRSLAGQFAAVYCVCTSGVTAPVTLAGTHRVSATAQGLHFASGAPRDAKQTKGMMMEIRNLLEAMVGNGASDLYLLVDNPPLLRVEGVNQRVGETLLAAADTEAIALALMNEVETNQFRVSKEMNLGVSVDGVGRFRVNVLQQRGSVGLVIRHIKTVIPTLDELHLPPILKDIVMTKRGLILVTGATGSGKSTTLAAMIGHRNEHSRGHIITVEDPVEFVHPNVNCCVTQREVGSDTASFGAALKNTLRQAPDVILIGEIRDLETMEAAITFAETGHLCLGTLHSSNANQTLQRVMNFFPGERHAEIYLQLSLNLRAVLSQRLVPGVEGRRVAAIEILLDTPWVKELIRKGEVDIIKEAMERGVNEGCRTFDEALLELYAEGRIAMKDALDNADSSNNLRIKLGQTDAKRGVTPPTSTEPATIFRLDGSSESAAA